MEVEKRIAEAISRPTTEDDTHPGPSDRFRLVRDVSGNGVQVDSTPVWDLFGARQQLTTEMTSAVARRIEDVGFVAT
jgi:hypothetical protein